MSLTARNALIALVITGAIIGSVVYAVGYLDRQRVTELNGIEDQLAIDTLSVETQFSLLESAPCEDISEGTTLSDEVSNLGNRLSSTESHLGSTNAEVIRLKQQYTLLEIRDYLLAKRVSSTCHTKPPVIVLYFYSNKNGECADCDRAGAALSYLHENYPGLRVYSFDYNLELGALRTLVTVEKIRPQFPAFVIQGVPMYGFTTLSDFEKAFPKSLFATSTSATSSPKKN